MGYTMRTDQYRLVVWKNHKQANSEPIFIELYDHQNDPDETRNIAKKSPEQVAALLKQFEAGWRSNLPASP